MNVFFFVFFSLILIPLASCADSLQLPHFFSFYLIRVENLHAKKIGRAAHLLLQNPRNHLLELLPHIYCVSELWFGSLNSWNVWLSFVGCFFLNMHKSSRPPLNGKTFENSYLSLEYAYRNVQVKISMQTESKTTLSRAFMVFTI